MGFNDGIFQVSLAKLSDNILSTGAYLLTDTDEYSPVINAVGEAFLLELKDRVGTKSIEWHTIDLRKFSDAELTLAETQLESLSDEAPEPLPGYFTSFKLAVHDELLRRKSGL
jgi:hypothetical protein